jgi:hypothetical protein
VIFSLDPRHKHEWLGGGHSTYDVVLDEQLGGTGASCFVSTDGGCEMEYHLGENAVCRGRWMNACFTLVGPTLRRSRSAGC